MNEFKTCQAGGDSAMGLLEGHRAGRNPAISSDKKY